MADEFSQYIDELGGKFANWAEGLSLMLPDIVVALIIMILAWASSRGLSHLMRRLLTRTNVGEAPRRLMQRLLRFTIIALGFIIALHVLQLDKAVTTLLAGAGIVGLALGFAFQDLSANFIAGIGLSSKRPMEIGDIVETNGLYGRVEVIHLRTTSIRQTDGKVVIIPNRKIFENELINYSREGQLRVEVEGGVSYKDDIEKVREVVLEAVKEVRHIENRPVEMYFTEFNDFSVDFIARFWVDYSRPADLVKARSDAMRSIKRTFDENNITIPFPIRTLDFSTGKSVVPVDLASNGGEGATA